MIPECPICGQEMLMVKKMNTTKQYKARRFHCGLCDTYETVFGDGSFSQSQQAKAIEAAENIGVENEAELEIGAAERITGEDGHDYLIVPGHDEPFRIVEPEMITVTFKPSEDEEPPTPHSGIPLTPEQYLHYTKPPSITITHNSGQPGQFIRVGHK